MLKIRDVAHVAVALAEVYDSRAVDAENACGGWCSTTSVANCPRFSSERLAHGRGYWAAGDWMRNFLDRLMIAAKGLVGRLMRYSGQGARIRS